MTNDFNLTCLLATMPEAEYTKLLADAATLREHLAKRAPVELAPEKKKPGRPKGSKRKAKVAPQVSNGAPTCGTHGVPMVLYGDEYKCGRCAQE